MTERQCTSVQVSKSPTVVCVPYSERLVALEKLKARDLASVGGLYSRLCLQPRQLANPLNWKVVGFCNHTTPAWASQCVKRSSLYIHLHSLVGRLLGVGRLNLRWLRSRLPARIVRLIETRLSLVGSLIFRDSTSDCCDVHTNSVSSQYDT